MVEEFVKLFTGLTDNFGKADMSKAKFDTERNKIKPEYMWTGHPITSTHYQEHLDGKISIGIQPCTRQGKVSFGCIDIDPTNYKDFKISTLLFLIEKHKLPVVPCRSKSGGLHIYIFLKEEISAQAMRDSLLTLLLPLELKRTTELYPKQVELIDTPGQFINLPYQNTKETTRYAFNKNNEPLSLDEFIKAAHNSQLAASELNALVTKCNEDILKGGDPEFADGPPCLQRLSKNKLTDGRDRFMYNYMVFAKKKYKDSWPDKVNEANKYFQTPWTLEEINKKIKFWKKDTAGHTCNDEPIHSQCMKHICVQRAYGVISDSTKAFPHIYGLTIVNYTLPLLRFMVEKPDGEPAECEMLREDFPTQRKLLNTIYGHAHFMPDSLTPIKYREFLNRVMIPKPTVIDPPEGAAYKDQLYPYLYEFCINGTRATKKSEIRGGLCWTEGGYHHFLWTAFLETLPTRWHLTPNDTSIILKKDYKAEFGHSYNIGKSQTIRCVRLKQLHIDQLEYHPTEKKKKDNF